MKKKQKMYFASEDQLNQIESNLAANDLEAVIAIDAIRKQAVPSELCKELTPNPYYSLKRRGFCVQQFCKNWVYKKTRCIDLDPAAGSTYEVTEAHCGLDDKKRRKR